MAQLRQDYDQFKALGAEVIVIGPEGPDEFVDFWNKNGMPFPGIPDPQQQVLNRYGQEFKLLRLGRMPAQALIDTEGIVRFVHYGDAMTDIPSTGEMLQLVAQLKEEAQQRELAGEHAYGGEG